MNEFYPYLTRYSLLLLVFLGSSQLIHAQVIKSELSFLPTSYQVSVQDSTSTQYPNPSTVLRRSLVVPGWGQITNRHYWKVPIIYGLLGGLVYYSIYLTTLYHDYRAAFYNLSNDDLRFGATPNNLAGLSSRELRNTRDLYRNRRDLIYVGIALAHLLNVVDAYVYAHLRSFDVSDDLSFTPSIAPEFIPTGDLVMVTSFKVSIALGR